MGVQDRDWYWAHRDSVTRNRYWPKSFRTGRSGSDQVAAASAGPVSLPWRIAVGVLAGLLLASTVPQVTNHFRQQRAAERAAETAARLTFEAEQQANADAAREQARRRAIVEQESLRDAAARARADTISRQEAQRQADLRRRERAWTNFYVRSDRCKVNTDVECANEFIRAKSAFDAKWPVSQP